MYEQVQAIERKTKSLIVLTKKELKHTNHNGDKDCSNKNTKPQRTFSFEKL